MAPPLDYIGEHMLPGQLGTGSISLSFVSICLGAFAFWKYHKSKEDAWYHVAKWTFIIHAISIFIGIATLFLILVNGFLEYRYAYAHTSADLPFQYIFSAFWEDQEGSFLLWIFWHAVLGLFLLRKRTLFTPTVLLTLSLIQIFLLSMILGVYIPWFGDTVKIGSNPFIMLRDTMAAPIFNNASYLSLIKGVGLNPLLQNYWMTIHPPTLFLGFASTSIPFCFVVSSLMTKDYSAWLKPAIQWSLFSAAILGLGVLMGSAWAYEALSFGGFWAWDPVENMSLVPWIIMIAGIHTNLIALSTKRAIRSTYLFYGASFLLILYSTFLTRSGILGDTSVHAFTEMGLEWQLVGLMFFFFFLWLIPLISNWNKIPHPAQEERAASREFWMIMGSMILLLSSLLISFTTSIPVINKLMDGIAWVMNTNYEHLHRTAPIDPVAHHNQFQLWVAMIIAILSSLGQFLHYKQLFWQSHNRAFLKSLGITAIISALLTSILYSQFSEYGWPYVLLFGLCLFSILANLKYLFSSSLIHSRIWSVTSHMGFAIMILGTLYSGLKKEFISTNTFFNRDLLSAESVLKNVVLYKDLPLQIKDYEVTYMGSEIQGFTRQFDIRFRKKNDINLVIDEFVTHPNILYEKTFAKVAASNPDTKHFWNRDIFTHIARLPSSQIDLTSQRKMDDSLEYKLYTTIAGDTLFTKNFYLYVSNISSEIRHPDYVPSTNDIALGVVIIIGNEVTVFDTIYPGSVIRDNIIYRYSDVSNKTEIKIKIPDDYMEAYLQSMVFTPHEMIFKVGEKKKWNDYNIKFKGFNNKSTHPDYVAKEGDVTVGAKIEIYYKDDLVDQVEPLYLIRDNLGIPYSVLAQEHDIHISFNKIDPEEENIYISLSKKEYKFPNSIDLLIADDVPRNDFIVLEAIEFPGINLFWLGSLMVLMGLFGSWIRKRIVHAA